MVCCMVWSICACITKTSSRIGGGGGLAALFVSALLFSTLQLRFLVLTILRIYDTSKKGGGEERSEIIVDKEIHN
jgi:hypothetical protein